LSGTTNLIAGAQQLAEIVNGSNAGRSGENGARQPSARPRANGKPRRPKKSPAGVEESETGGPRRPDESS
jgi:hypothetical protein